MPRDVIIRQDGRTSFVALSPRRQMQAATLLGVLVLWAFASTALLVLGRNFVARAEAQLVQTESRLALLARAVEAGLAADRRGIGLDALPALAEGLVSERTQLAHSNLMLNEAYRVALADMEAANAEQRRLRDTIRQTQFSLELTGHEMRQILARGAGLGAALKTAQDEMSGVRAEQDMLEHTVHSMRLDHAAVAEMVAFLESGHSRLHGKIAALQRRLAGTRRYSDELNSRLADSKRALARAAGPWAVQKAERSGLDLIDFLFPMHQLPPGGAAEPALVLAIIRQESGFSDKAISPAGATGLMQLMPDTAEHVARKLDIGFDIAKLSDDPEFNTRLGRAYLDLLLRRFDGSYLLAVAAYNAGPNRVDEWIREFGDPRRPGVDPESWAKQIPYRETRVYVQAVLLNLAVYRQRLAQPAPPQVEAMLAEKYAATDVIR